MCEVGQAGPQALQVGLKILLFFVIVMSLAAAAGVFAYTRLRLPHGADCTGAVQRPVRCR